MSPVGRYVLGLLVRNRLLAMTTAFGLVLLAVSLALAELTPGMERRTFFDAAYLGLEVLAVMVPLIATVILHAQEHDQRTLWLVLTRPVTRSAYVWGRGAGLAAAAWVALALVAAALAVLAWSMRALPDPFLLPVFTAAVLEAVVVSALACLASAVATSAATAFVMAGGVVLLGYLSGILPSLVHKAAPAGKVLWLTLYWTLPHLSDFAVRDFTSPPEDWYLAQLCAYAVAYAGCVMIAAAAAFRAREL